MFLDGCDDLKIEAGKIKDVNKSLKSIRDHLVEHDYTYVEEMFFDPNKETELCKLEKRRMKKRNFFDIAVYSNIKKDLRRFMVHNHWGYRDSENITGDLFKKAIDFYIKLLLCKDFKPYLLGGEEMYCNYSPVKIFGEDGLTKLNGDTLTCREAKDYLDIVSSLEIFYSEGMYERGCKGDRDYTLKKSSSKLLDGDYHRHFSGFDFPGEKFLRIDIDDYSGFYERNNDIFLEHMQMYHRFAYMYDRHKQYCEEEKNKRRSMLRKEYNEVLLKPYSKIKFSTIENRSKYDGAGWGTLDEILKEKYGNQITTIGDTCEELMIVQHEVDELTVDKKPLTGAMFGKAKMFFSGIYLSDKPKIRMPLEEARVIAGHKITPSRIEDYFQILNRMIFIKYSTQKYYKLFTNSLKINLNDIIFPNIFEEIFNDGIEIERFFSQGKYR